VELRRADAQHGDATDLYVMLAVLGEEFGELQKAALQFDYEGGNRDALLKECIQVGAMACKTFRFIAEQVPTPAHPLRCPTCGRGQEEVGGTAEIRFCPDAFHVFGESTL
jgi:hypothetical protein